MTRPRGFIKWRPQRKAAAHIEQVHKILAQNADFLPLSLRQIFYLGVSSFAWPKTEKFYKSLGLVLSNARRARLIDFNAIRDDGVLQSRAKVWNSQGAFLRTIEYNAETFRLDPMTTQGRDVIVWTEGKGIVPMVRQFVDTYGLEVATSGGFYGLSFKKQMADRFVAKAGIVLHIGDFDPSGEVMHNALREDLVAFGADIVFHRIAVTEEQIDNLSLPNRPPKTKENTHARSFKGDRAVELESIMSPDLQAILVDAVEGVLDMDAFRTSEADSARIRTKLIDQVRQMRGIDGVSG